MDIYKEKYLKYKSKYLNLKNTKKNNKIGGLIKENIELEKILSIGFEFETGSYTKFNISGYNLTNDTDSTLKKILSEMDNNITLEVTEDWADLSINKHFENLKYDTQDLLKLFIGRKINYDNNGKIIYLSENVISEFNITLKNGKNKLPTTEFHVTFRSVESNNNIIINAFKKACEILVNYINSCIMYESFMKKKNINNNYDVFNLPGIHTLFDYNNNVVYIPINKEDDPSGDNSKYKYPSIKNSKYMIQTTISVKYDHIIEILFYLLKNKDGLNDKRFEKSNKISINMIFIFKNIIFNEILNLNKIIKNYNNEQNFSNSFINTINEKISNLEYFITSDILKSIEIWLTLIIYKVFAYVYLAANNLPYLKFAMAFVIRHSMVDLCPIELNKRNDFYDIIIKKVIPEMNPLDNDFLYKDLLTSYLENLNNNLDEVNLSQFVDIFSTRFQYTNKIVFIELRNFNKLIKDYALIEEKKSFSYSIIEQIASF